jgi:hypothetical protein
MPATVLQFPAIAKPRALPSSTAAFVLQQLQSVQLTMPERLALIDCLVWHDRPFADNAHRHGIDRERLQDLYFDLFTVPERAGAAQDRS